MAILITKTIDQIISGREDMISRLQASIDWQLKGQKTGSCVGTADFAHLIAVLQDCNRTDRMTVEKLHSKSDIAGELAHRDAEIAQLRDRLDLSASRLEAAMSEDYVEIAALKACLKTANANAEKFEREWYLRGDEIEALRQDAERLDALDRLGEAYGVHEHEGNRWLIEGPFKSLRVAIDESLAQAVKS